VAVGFIGEGKQLYVWILWGRLVSTMKLFVWWLWGRLVEERQLFCVNIMRETLLIQWSLC